MIKAGLTLSECVPGPQFEKDVLAQRSILIGYARRLYRGHVDADDLVQETLFKALDNRCRFRAGTNIRGWLLRIMHNLYVSQFHRDKREVLVDVDTVAWSSVGPSQEWSLHLQDAERIIATLPRDQRLALMDVSGGAAYEDTAALLGCRVGTIKSRVSRARHKLALGFSDLSQPALGT